ncbi:MAG: type II toxin-antitoxin system HicB family antitoxin [Bacteroidales bacterium]|nr:type II toxin-antitoxin system HicB family antitoxin [Candidatus Cryptobacteroides choladohippi]MCQ2180126.1 type II toxin-antitoxin system HicB family antitoxin [Bacteroidales bacterium]
MKKVIVVIERAENNFSAYVQDVDGITATGKTIEEIKTSIINAVEEYKSACRNLGLEVPAELKGDYEIAFELDIQSFLMIYQGIFTKSGLEKLTGINQKQLWHYANGVTKPRQAQRRKIESALHRLGNELLSLSL